MKILGLSGSLRTESLNTALLVACSNAMPPGIDFTMVSTQLPLFNPEDVSDTTNQVTKAFSQKITQADAVLIAVPEYNYGITGVLKNAIDWASRPAYASPFANKPVGILGATPSTVGTARAQSHLRQVLFGLTAQIFPYPEFLVGGAHKKFQDQKLTDPTTIDLLSKYLETFIRWTNVAKNFTR